MTLHVNTATVYWVTLNVSSLWYDPFIHKNNERYSAHISRYRSPDRAV